MDIALSWIFASMAGRRAAVVLLLVAALATAAVGCSSEDGNPDAQTTPVDLVDMPRLDQTPDLAPDADIDMDADADVDARVDVPPDADIPEGDVTPDLPPQPDSRDITDTDTDMDMFAEIPDFTGIVPTPGVVVPMCPGMAASPDAALGWANLQFPATLEVMAETVSDPVYGQVWRMGQTEGAGQATGWRADLMVGPWGTDPLQHPDCWHAVPAEYNTDANNNDEYWTRLYVQQPGLYGMVYRYEDAGGTYVYGDVDGAGAGTGVNDPALLTVLAAEAQRPLRLLTLNLRCRADDWPARRPLVEEALIGLNPDIIALQEDCAVPGGTFQSEELQAIMANGLGRGYAHHRVTTHQAMHDGQTYDEGIALLSAWPMANVRDIALPFANFPRQAVAADITLGADLLGPIRVYATHFDYGAGNDAIRTASAQVILDDPKGLLPAIVMGDLNATPDSPAVMLLGTQGLIDAWPDVHPADPGLTMPASNPTRRIDYIFVDARLGGIGTAELVDNNASGVWLSDHKGVLVTLDL